MKNLEWYNRVEPLICKDHMKKRPVIIPYHRGGKRLHIGFQVGLPPQYSSAIIVK